jgi:hypothetical protein
MRRLESTLVDRVASETGHTEPGRKRADQVWRAHEPDIATIDGFGEVDPGRGTYLHAVVAAAILGILSILLDIVGFGVILGRGAEAGRLAGLFGFASIVFGSLIGAGFVLSGRATLSTD